MDLRTSRDNIEIQKAWEAFNCAEESEIKKQKVFQKGFTTCENQDIIKWDESLHPRDEHGRFTNSGGFGGASSSDFANAIADAKATVDAKNAWRVTAHTEEELNEDYPDAALHITPGGSTVAVTSDGDIISVCGNSNDTIKGRELMKLATENGGIKLDSYSGNHGFYVKCGFEPVSWCKWDDQYAPDGWDSKRDDREPIVFYKYTGNTGPYSAESLNVNNFLASTPASADYDAAQAARDRKM